MNAEVNNYDDQELNRNLPVLYTIPKWQLKVIPYGTIQSAIHYIPEVNRWVCFKSLGRTLTKLGIDHQSWFDRWYLNITVPSDRPRCKAGCGRERRFLSLSAGYSTMCAEAGIPNEDGITCYHKVFSEAQYLVDRRSEEYRAKLSDSITKAHADPVIKAKYDEANKKVGAKLSIISKVSQNRPEVKLKKSKSARKAHADPNKYVNGNIGLGGHRRGIRSRVISIYTNSELRFDSEFERKFYGICTEDPTIYKLVRPNCRIKYYIPGDEVFHTYNPDFLIFRVNSEVPELVEVKPEYFMDDDIVVAKRTSAIEYCKKTHLIHYTVTEKFLNSHDDQDKHYHVTEDDWI